MTQHRGPTQSYRNLQEENERMREQLERIESYALAARADGEGAFAFAIGRIQVAASIGLRGHTEGPALAGGDEP